MEKKFVVYNPITKEYFKRNYGVTTETKRARLYNRTGDARNSLNRKNGHYGSHFSVYEVGVDFPMDGLGNTPFNTMKAVNDGTALPFSVVVKYFQSMYQIDISGQCGGYFPLSVDLIAAFYRRYPPLRGMTNGACLMLTDSGFDAEMPLVMMLVSEIIKMFGYESQGKRAALLEIDWFNEDGSLRTDY